MNSIFKKILIGLGALFIVVVFLSIISEEPEVGTKSNITQSTSDWIKYSNNPVLKEQPSSNFFQWAGDPFVLIDGSEYKMWFGANVRDGITNIGYATSSDGKEWKIYPVPVLKKGDEGQWDDFSVETPSVVKNSDGTYEMWYTGAGGIADESDPSTWEAASHKIGYAKSNDGINWDRHYEPVLNVEFDNPEKWDYVGKADPMIIKDNNIYKLWYTGAGIIDDKMVLQIGYATSDDGINWKKHKNNPVFTLGESKAWDDGSVSTPSVFYEGDQYVLLYTGIDKPEKGVESGSIGCATSDDGINWVRESNPCLTKGEKKEFDNAGLWGPHGLYNNNIYEVWYGALKMDSDIHVNVGYASKNK